MAFSKMFGGVIARMIYVSTEGGSYAWAALALLSLLWVIFAARRKARSAQPK